MKVYNKFLLRIINTACLLFLLGNMAYGQGMLSSFFSTGDSSAVYYFYEDNFVVDKLNDTLGHFQRINPMLKGEIDQQYLGNIGAAHYNLIYQPRYRRGFDLGFHSYDGYLVTRDQVPFYNNKKAYTDVQYSAGSQDEAIISAKFAQNVSPRANLYLSYNRINHQGGIDRQRALHSNYTFSGWYHAPNETYRLLASFASNTIRQQNNGGITADSLLNDDLYLTRPNLLPINLSASQTEYSHSEYSLSQYWNPFAKGKKVARFVMDTLPAPDSLLAIGDSIVLVKRKVPPPAMSDDPSLPEFSFLRHQLTLRQQKIKFYDDRLAADSSFYGDFQTNELGLRHFVKMRSLENNFSIRLFLGKTAEKGRPFLFEPGITHILHWLNQEPEKSVFNDLLVTARMETHLQDWVRLEGRGYFSIGNNPGDYLVKGKLVGNLKEFGTIEAAASQQLHSPNLLQERFFLSETNIWENEFDKSLETTIYGKYSLPLIKTSVEGRYNLINKLIYYGEEKAPLQATENINIAQLIVSNELELFNFHLENKAAAQLISSDILQLPKFWLRSSLFYENIIFKGNLQTRVGFDLRYNTSYFGDRYSVMNSQFYRQQEVELSPYPIVDVFFNFKVQRFRAFLKVENLSQLVLGEAYFTAPNYPGRGWLFKFGASWTFID